MNVPARKFLDDVLAADQRCLGAIFSSYTFDPVYFEDHVLRALLRLSGDPDEDAGRYHEEARAALRETPVTCFIDASVRTPGRRLPYDLHLVRVRTFHPKLSLVLYPDEARLTVGSGNLTRAGLERNTELFFQRALRYDVPADAALLRRVDAFFTACADLCASEGNQLAQVQAVLRAHLATTPAPATTDVPDVALVDTFTRSGLRWLADAIPAEATIERIGVLAPFFERDDLGAADGQTGLTSVIDQLVHLRPGSRPTLELGVPWDDAPLARPATSPAPTLAAGPGLWAVRGTEAVDGEEVDAITYVLIVSVGPKQVELRGNLARRKYPRVELEQMIADGQMWPVSRPTVHAPATILRRVAAELPVELWLHPTSSLDSDGRPAARPLHAKAFLVTANHGGGTSTYAMIGSANASHAALGASVAERGNVEAGVLFRLTGRVGLSDLLPALAPASLDAVELIERDSPTAQVDLSAWIDEVVHHADARTLTVTWASAGPAPLAAWTLRYIDRVIARGHGADRTPTLITGFELATSSAELTFEAGGAAWAIPIRVADLAVLPIRPGLEEPDLRALLAQLGRRVGAERLATVRALRGASGVAAVLDAVFGEGFGPTDIFKAWWGLRDELSRAPTVAAFRNHLHGTVGALAVWRRLSDAPPELLARAELWIYGCELCRELDRVQLPDGPDRALRAELLHEVAVSIRDDLRTLEPPGGDHAWIDAVHRFYGTLEAP